MDAIHKLYDPVEPCDSCGWEVFWGVLIWRLPLIRAVDEANSLETVQKQTGLVRRALGPSSLYTKLLLAKRWNRGLALGFRAPRLQVYKRYLTKALKSFQWLCRDNLEPTEPLGKGLYGLGLPPQGWPCRLLLPWHRPRPCPPPAEAH